MLTHYDVENLNRAMGNMGQAITENRRDKERMRHDTADEQFRQKMAEVADQRASAAQAHWDKMEGAQAASANKAEQAAALKEKQALLKTAATLNASGQLKDLDGVNEWLRTDEHFKHTGFQLITPPSKLPPQVGQNAVAAALKQADDWRTKASSAQDPQQQQRYTDYATKLESWADLQGKEKPDPTQFQTEVQKYPGTPAVEPTPARPGKRHLFGPNDPEIPATPGSPAMPERTVTVKRPIGAAPAAPLAPAGPMPGAAGKPLDEATARNYLKRAGGDKAKARQMATQDGFTLQ